MGIFFNFIFFSCFSLHAQPVDFSNREASTSFLTEKVLWISGLNDSESVGQVKKKTQKCFDLNLNSKNRDPQLCELVEDIKTGFSQVVNFEDLIKSKIVYFTERHHRPDAKEFLIKNLASLKRNGFTYFAMEMWNSSAQDILDSFSDAKVSLEEFQNTFSKGWTYSPERYFELMFELRKQGFIIIGIDNRDTMSVDSKKTMSLEFNERDGHMTDTIANILMADVKAKILVYTGHLHGYTHFSSQQPSQIERLRQKTGVVAQTFMILDDKSTSPLRAAFLAIGQSQGFVSLDVNKYSIDGFFINEK